MGTVVTSAEYDITIDIPDSDIDDILTVTPADVDPSGHLSFCRNVFIPLTTACRYTCTYCTYYDPPGQASLLSPEEVRDIVQMGAEAGCTEALFTFGDDPDERYVQIHDQLSQWGYDSIHVYLRDCCEIALDEGLLPHANPGDQTRDQMATVADVNASMGVMLETTADVQVHRGPRGKTPAQRLNTLRNAGELGVPFTTGILVGIGETWRDRAESILAIATLHEQYGHIQEVIIQPVVENDRWQGGSPDTDVLRRVVSMARAGLPAEVSIQVPPNLAPVEKVLNCGIDDLGGVSPITDDHINPEYTWPELNALKQIAKRAGVPLRERLPIYQRFLPPKLRSQEFDGSPAKKPENERDGGWISKQIHEILEDEDDSAAARRYRRVLAGHHAISSKQSGCYESV